MGEKKGFQLEGTPLLVAVNTGLVLAQIAFGAYHVVGKEALQYIDAVVFAFYREIIAGPALVIIAIIIERVKPNVREDWWRFLFLGLTGVYLNQLLFILGLELTSATQAAIMQPCIPVFTTAFTLILRTEKFAVLKVLGILCSAGGAVVLVGLDNLSFKSNQFKGTLCLLGNTLAMSVYYIFQKPVLKKYPPISVTGWGYIIGSVMMGVTSLIRTQAHWADYKVNEHVYFPLGYSIVGATIFTYMTLTWANKHAPASVVAAYSSLQPLTAAALSYFIEGIVPTKNQYIGGAAIIVGLILVTVARVIESRKEAARAYHPINSLPFTTSPYGHDFAPPAAPYTTSAYGRDFVISSGPPGSPTGSGSGSSRKYGKSDNQDIQRKSFSDHSQMASTPPIK
jgi:drug/metabolite transporter (DMT)-like permease